MRSVLASPPARSGGKAEVAQLGLRPLPADQQERGAKDGDAGQRSGRRGCESLDARVRRALLVGDHLGRSRSELPAVPLRGQLLRCPDAHLRTRRQRGAQLGQPGKEGPLEALASAASLAEQDEPRLDAVQKLCFRALGGLDLELHQRGTSPLGRRGPSLRSSCGPGQREHARELDGVLPQRGERLQDGALEELQELGRRSGGGLQPGNCDGTSHAGGPRCGGGPHGSGPDRMLLPSRLHWRKPRLLLLHPGTGGQAPGSLGLHEKGIDNRPGRAHHRGGGHRRRPAPEVVHKLRLGLAAAKAGVVAGARHQLRCPRRQLGGGDHDGRRVLAAGSRAPTIANRRPTGICEVHPVVGH
mmetsp:Transcript_93197/g.287602  ORF Transcript_93197/g.287602 Transcript_93197/m.287602 type:complete len:357 (+) Transcript_93197:201-1271(+)